MCQKFAEIESIVERNEYIVVHFDFHYIGIIVSVEKGNISILNIVQRE